MLPSSKLTWQMEHHHFKQEIRRYIIKGSDAVRECFGISWGGSSQRRGRDAVRERRGKLYCLVVWSAWEGAILGFINIQKSIITDITAAAPPIEQVGRCIFLTWCVTKCVTKYDSICSPFGIRTLSHSHTEENTFGRLSWISLHFLSLTWKLSLKHNHLRCLCRYARGRSQFLRSAASRGPMNLGVWAPWRATVRSMVRDTQTRLCVLKIFGKMCKYHVLLPSKKDGEGFFWNRLIVTRLLLNVTVFFLKREDIFRRFLFFPHKMQRKHIFWDECLILLMVQKSCTIMSQ